MSLEEKMAELGLELQEVVVQPTAVPATSRIHAIVVQETGQAARR